MNKEKLIKIANQMVAPGKGILAADESTPTCTKRFNSIGIESTPLSRNEYRDMLFTSPGLEKYVSGIIMFDETIKQKTIECNIPFPEYLKNKGILSGIKVDTGAKNLAGKDKEKITEGLDGLRERLIEYTNLGASFTKWRAVINIDEKNLPTKTCIDANAHALARYASLCQENNLVPIVEPEILMDGSHNINRCYEVTKNVLNIVFKKLKLFDVFLEGIILKPNMVICGKNCQNSCSDDPEKVAEMTLKCLKETVPTQVPGVAFLSGGQSSEKATSHLYNMNSKLNDFGNNFWNLTFSYGRALQEDALNSWKDKNKEKSQEKLLKRAKNNSLACQGKIS